MQRTPTPTSPSGIADGRRRERGSAMVISVLVMAIMTLLGISFLLMAETENQIAENEKLAAQAMYVGEATVGQVKRWFDRPRSSSFFNWNLHFPPNAVVDRTVRLVDDDGDPGTAPFAQDGTTWPRYKQGIDLTGAGNAPDTIDDLFDRPYRGSLEHTLMGTVDGPDMRIDENFSTAAAAFLDQLSERLVADFPDRSKGVEAKISRIDVYQPPHVNIAGNWTRYGMGTVAVNVQIVKPETGGGERVVAERTVRAVLNQMPYPGPYGPLQSCKGLEYNGDFVAHWGVTTSLTGADAPNNLHKLKSSWPRDIPPSPKLDLLWGWNAPGAFDDYHEELSNAGEALEDPWFRFVTGGEFDNVAGWGANPADDQPFPFSWTIGDSLGADTYSNHDHGGDDGTHSNLVQRQATVTCPTFEYDVWKNIATSGGSDTHYYTWSSGTSFQENGGGTPQTFRAITDNPARTGGLYFFDTTNGFQPIDGDADGFYDNLTPEIQIQGGTWGSVGFLYVNAVSIQTRGVGGRPSTWAAPGEPYADADQNGLFDAGERWVNLQYPTTLGGDFIVDETNYLQNDGTVGATAVRNTRGPSFTEDANVWGILFNSGQFEATGNGTFFGSVVAESGIGENSPAAGTPQFYWDESILSDWPPSNWNMPRVAISRWETDLRD